MPRRLRGPKAGTGAIVLAAQAVHGPLGKREPLPDRPRGITCAKRVPAHPEHGSQYGTAPAHGSNDDQ